MIRSFYKSYTTVELQNEKNDIKIITFYDRYFGIFNKFEFVSVEKDEIKGLTSADFMEILKDIN